MTSVRQWAARLIWAMLAWALAIAAGGARADDIALDPAHGEVDLARRVSVLVDDGRSLSLEAAKAAFARGEGAPAEPARGGELNFGYRAADIWLHFSVAAAAPDDARWLLEVGFPSLDRVEFHAFGPGGEAHQVAGDRIAFHARPWQHRSPVFPLPQLAPGERLEVYVKVASEGSLTVPLRLWTQTALGARDQRAYSEDALYFGMLTALALYNLLLWVALREQVFLRYVGFVASLAVGFAGQTGAGGEFLWPAWPTWSHLSFPVGMALTGFFGTLFTRSFLDTRNTVPRLDRCLAVAAWVFLAAVAAHLVVGYRFAAMLTSLAGIGFAPIAALAGVRGAVRGHPGARVFLLAWALLLVGVVVMAMRNFGWLPTVWLTTHAMQIGSALEMLLLSFAMADRINVMRREREAARQALVDTLQEAGQRLEQRVAERTAELQAANRRLRDNELALQQLAFHDPLTGLYNRVMLEERIRHAMLRADRQDTQLAVLLLDLDGFKAVNDGYGHAVGDAVLAAAATRMKAQVRASDTVARLGGDEFVVVLEPFSGEDQAVRVAAKLVAALAEPVVESGVAHQIGASIGIALYPADGRDVDQLILAADRAMYRVKAAGKGGWRRNSPEQAAHPAGLRP
ncbi:diguanylate cyclase [Azoarcus olearius]|uniref:GGDEF domain-containing protein n=1 Tax=Azoarcus sp. (strain BH72) TaxID=418699 RepID=A1K3A2_AZOSB|nr:diguanylate cyclase [Azoarcus olearius]CAL93307.1 conserved hypothetical protein [Azoarcus olearius]